MTWSVHHWLINIVQLQFSHDILTKFRLFSVHMSGENGNKLRITFFSSFISLFIFFLAWFSFTFFDQRLLAGFVEWLQHWTNNREQLFWFRIIDTEMKIPIRKIREKMPYFQTRRKKNYRVLLKSKLPKCFITFISSSGWVLWFEHRTANQMESSRETG